MGARARRNAVRAADWIITYVLAAVFTIVIVLPLPGQAGVDATSDEMIGGVPRNILDTVQLFTKVAQCTREGWACVRLNSSRRQVRLEGRSWRPLSEVKGLEPKDQPFPTVPRVTTDPPGRKPLPPAHLRAQVRTLTSIRECFCISTYQVLARASHLKSKRAVFRDRAIRDLQESCEQITIKRAFVTDPVFKFAENQISADASTSFGCGMQVRPILVAIAWKVGTFEAIERSRKRLPGEAVSISPLELLVQGWLIEIICTFLVTLPGEQILGRTDSESSESVINSGRVSSPPMAEAMYIVTRNQDKFNIVYRVKHIPSLDNTIPDMLSKNRIAEALALTKERWGKAYLLEIPPEMRQRWLEDESRVVKAASH